MKICILLGGSGYIGTKIIERFLERGNFDKIYIGDIRKSEIQNNDKVVYKYIDVRDKIELEIEDNIDLENSWIFNLAAVHREPGHEAYEYYETNIKGAENVTEFAEKIGIKNIFFTSSIAPYGKSREQKFEDSLLQPVTPYGISKSIAEKIHLIWQARDYNNRRLIICRPSVIYGPGDPGNILRMIKAIKRGTFFFPGSPDIIKAYGYIYGLLDSIEFTMNMKDKNVITYNYTEWPLLTMRQLGEVIKKFFNISKPIPTMPMALLVPVAYILNNIGKPFNKFQDIHPVRVKKAGFPTNIKPQFLIDHNFEFKYPFEKSLEHWRRISPEDFK